MNHKENNTTAVVVDRPMVVNPFAATKQQHVNAGTVEIESARAIAEVQASLIIADSRPRDEHRAFEKMVVSCSRMAFASKAFYSYPRGGQAVSGPSIRMAEELARIWGNMEYGIRELSQRDGETEMEAYAWDLETNMRSSQRFTVKHERSTGGSTKKLTDQRDIYELGANMGARRLRSRILAILPPDYVDGAVQQCAMTISGGSQETMEDRVKKMLKAFSAIGVKKQHVEAYLKIKLADILPEQFTDLLGIYNSIKDGHTKATDWFSGGTTGPAEGSSLDNLNKGITTKAPEAATAQPEASQGADDDPVI